MQWLGSYHKYQEGLYSFVVWDICEDKIDAHIKIVNKLLQYIDTHLVVANNPHPPIKLVNKYDSKNGAMVVKVIVSID